jgi:3-isopropylmalate/(R)-2-methylmalate dehydratase large subunit
MAPRTLFAKIWDDHVVRPETPDTPAVLYVDLHLIHEVTSPQAFTLLRERRLRVRRPERTVATMDHSTPTTPRGADGRIPIAASSGCGSSRSAAPTRGSCTSSGRSRGTPGPG